MAYNRRNFLTKVVRIQQITVEHTQRGVSQEWLFHNIIEPQFCISRATYYNYLAINARLELKKLNNEVENIQKKAMHNTIV